MKPCIRPKAAESSCALRAAFGPDWNIAELVHDAVLSDRFWVFPHPDAVAALRPLVEAMLRGENPPVPAATFDANGLFGKG